MIVTHQEKLADFDIDVSVSCDDPILVLCGPSGSGKSTLLNAVAGLRSTGSSEITIADKVWQSSHDNICLTARQRDCAIVFQERTLFEHMTIEKNLDYAYKRRRTHQGGWDITTLIDMFQLETYRHRYPSHLSGGERQKVCLARALAANPQLLLLDEAFSAIDPKSRRRCHQIVKEFSQQFQRSVIVVSHDIIDAMTLADWVVLLKQGHVIAQGSLSQMTETITQDQRHSHMPTAILKGLSTSYDNDYALQTITFGEQSLFLPHEQAIEKDSDVSIEVRADCVSISRQKLEQVTTLNQLHGTIENLEAHGKASNLVDINVSGQKIFALITQKSCDRLHLKVGDEIYAQIKSMHLL